MTADPLLNLGLFETLGRILVAIAFIMALLFPAPSYTHQTGSDPDADWFRTLHAKSGVSCCHMQDCYRVQRDLEIKQNHYWLKYKGEWLEVPDEAILKDEPNPTGYPVACVHETYKAKSILCFIPVSQT